MRASLLEMFDPRVLLFDKPSSLDVLRNLLPMTISDFFLLITKSRILIISHYVISLKVIFLIK